MITITGLNGERHAVAASAVKKITEAGVSGKWHGIQCYVRLNDGTSIESIDSLETLVAAVEREISR